MYIMSILNIYYYLSITFGINYVNKDNIYIYIILPNFLPNTILSNSFDFWNKYL